MKDITQHRLCGSKIDAKWRSWHATTAAPNELAAVVAVVAAGPNLLREHLGAFAEIAELTELTEIAELRDASRKIAYYLLDWAKPIDPILLE
jgi:hypothetical protein